MKFVAQSCFSWFGGSIQYQLVFVQGVAIAHWVLIARIRTGYRQWDVSAISPGARRHKLWWLRLQHWIERDVPRDLDRLVCVNGAKCYLQKFQKFRERWPLMVSSRQKKIKREGCINTQVVYIPPSQSKFLNLIIRMTRLAVEMGQTIMLGSSICGPRAYSTLSFLVSPPNFMVPSCPQCSLSFYVCRYQLSLLKQSSCGPPIQIRNALANVSQGMSDYPLSTLSPKISWKAANIPYSIIATRRSTKHTSWRYWPSKASRRVMVANIHLGQAPRRHPPVHQRCSTKKSHRLCQRRRPDVLILPPVDH